MDNLIKHWEAESYLNVLFNPGECIWVAERLANNYKSVSQKFALVSSVGSASRDGIFVCYSPANDFGLQKKLINITRFRNLLVEFDGLSLDEQKALVEAIQLPYSTAVFSGGKSIHYMISLEEPVDYETYRQYAAQLAAGIPGMDKMNNRGTSYSRFPNGLRGEVEQSLIYCGERIKNVVFEEYLRSLQVDLPHVPTIVAEPILVTEPPEQVRTNPDLSRRQLLEWYAFEFLGKPRRANQILLKIRCPICAQSGHDTTGDNLVINLRKDHLFHCFAGATEHDQNLMPRIRQLMAEQRIANG